jgi:hypothetical protein
MDRKSWIIVTLCVILMGVNWHYMQENQKLAQAEAARKKQEEIAKQPPNRRHPASGETRDTSRRQHASGSRCCNVAGGNSFAQSWQRHL